MSRPYRSDLRARQARETRRAVVGAAAELFVRNGYAATTLDAVAEAAGVSRRTVTNAAGGKADLLKLAFDWALVGDDEPVPMVDRPAVARIRASRDALEAITLWVDLIVDVQGRTAAIARVLTVAADADPDVAALIATAERHRYLGALEFAEDLTLLGGLRPDLTREEVADVLWTCNGSALYQSLVVDRGWTAERFAILMVRTVSAALLA